MILNNMQKIILKDKEAYNWGHSFRNEKFEDLIEELNQEKKNAEEAGYSNLHIKFEWAGYDSPYEVVLKGDRLETDKDLEERKKSLLKQKKSNFKRLEKERKEYERLKKKFDK